MDGPIHWWSPFTNDFEKKNDFRQKIKKLESPEWRKRQFDNYVENTLKRSNSGRLQSSFRKPGLVPGMIFTICDTLQFSAEEHAVLFYPYP